jgi:hypothetical protein
MTRVFEAPNIGRLALNGIQREGSQHLRDHSRASVICGPHGRLVAPTMATTGRPACKVNARTPQRDVGRGRIRSSGVGVDRRQAPPAVARRRIRRTIDHAWCRTRRQSSSWQSACCLIDRHRIKAGCLAVGGRSRRVMTSAPGRCWPVAGVTLDNASSVAPTRSTTVTPTVARAPSLRRTISVSCSWLTFAARSDVGRRAFCPAAALRAAKRSCDCVAPGREDDTNDTLAPGASRDRQRQSRPDLRRPI